MRKYAMSSPTVSKTFRLVLSAILASLATFMTLSQLVFPFPVLPYLRFELAEVPVVAGFLLLGPAAGLTSAAIYWGILNFVGEWVPIGPLMKLLSLAPTLIGLWIGLEVYQRTLRKRGGAALHFGVGVSFGILSRVMVTTILNYVLLGYMFPFFLELAAVSIRAATGIDLAPGTSALIGALAFTAVFNIIHTFISVIPAYAIARAVVRAGIVEGQKIWIDTLSAP